VDLPTATEPAIPSTNGVRSAGDPAKESADGPVQLRRVLHIQPQQPAQREVDLCDFVEVELVAEAADAFQVAGSQRLRHRPG
jgi:hypothetical protein